jgi:hypothetical protein
MGEPIERRPQMAKTKDELKLMEGIAGTLLSVVTALRLAVVKLGGDFSDFHRLTTPEGVETVEQIAALIVGVKQKFSPKFPTWKTIRLGTGLLIRFNPKSIQGAVIWVALYAKPTRMATRRCSTWNAMTTACGSRATTATPTTSGTPTTSSSSSPASD